MISCKDNAMAKNKLLKIGILGLLIAVLSWASFDIARLFFENLVKKLGISNPYAVNLMIIGLVLIILAIFGISFRKALTKAFK
jgi:uncharacterized protein YqhQ